jgi:AsmA protein
LICGAYRWPIRSAKIGAELSQAISPSIGLHWRGPSKATLALLPWPTLRVIDAELAGADGKSLLSAPIAQFSLSPTELLRGRFVPVGATLRNPTAFVDFDAAPVIAAEEGALSAGGDGEPPALWSHVRLYGGVLHVVSAAHQFDTLIESLDGSFDWPSVDKPMSFSLAGAWRDEHVTIEGRIDNPREGLERRSTGVRLAIASRPLSFAMEGTWGGNPTSGFVGDVSAQFNSLRALRRLFGAAGAPLIVGDTLSLEGKAQSNGASLAVSDAQLDVAGQKFEGALTIAHENARTAISGTLAADSLNMESLFGAPPTLLNARGAWSAEPFGFAPTGGLDLDLRISATHVDWRGFRLDDAAGSLICKDGQLTASLLEAGAYQGLLKGQLSLTQGANGLETQITGSLADADIGAAVASTGWSGYRGRGGFNFSLRSTGFAPADSVASLSGVVSFDLQAGVIDGVNIEEAMRRSQRRPIDLSRDMANGQTTFTHARAKLVVANGAANIAEARIEGPGSAIDIAGAIDIAAREFHTLLSATQTDAQGAPSADAARLTIMLDGPWSAPTVAALAGGG